MRHAASRGYMNKASSGHLHHQHFQPRLNPDHALFLRSVIRGDLEMVKDLHSRGRIYSLHAPFAEGLTPSHVAAFHGYLEMLQWFHSKGCSLEVKADDGCTLVEGE